MAGLAKRLLFWIVGILLLLVGSGVIWLYANPPLRVDHVTETTEGAPKLIVIGLTNEGDWAVQLRTVIVDDHKPVTVAAVASTSSELVGSLAAKTVIEPTSERLRDLHTAPVFRYLIEPTVLGIPRTSYGVRLGYYDSMMPLEQVKISYRYLGLPFKLTLHGKEGFMR